MQKRFTQFFIRTNGIVIAIGLLLLFWVFLSYVVKVRVLFIPTPVKTFSTLAKLFFTSQFWSDVAYSWTRVFLAFTLSFLVAYPVVILALLSNKLKQGIFLFTEFFRYLPVPVFIPLTILWFGVGETGKIVIVFLGTFAQMIPLFFDSASLLSKSYTSFDASLKWRRLDYIKHIVVPGSAPLVWDDARVCFGWAWTYLIIGELVGAEHGLGYAIIRSQRYLATDRIFAYIIVIGLIGVITDRLLNLLKYRAFKWIQ